MNNNQDTIDNPFYGHPVLLKNPPLVLKKKNDNKIILSKYPYFNALAPKEPIITFLY